jgi:glycosyltransferase involved in cell wall biosynthesis
MGKQKITVSFFQRKPRTVGNYSVEFIFEDVRERLADLIDAKIIYSPYESSGVFKRLVNCWSAVVHQSDVNHVTGDINYLGLMLSKNRTVQTILDCVHLATSSGMKHKVLKYFWVTVPVKRARYITAISESTKAEILKYVDCDPGKIKVIYVAISGRFRRKEKAFNKAEPRILQIGTAPNKNIPRLIEALKGIPCILEIIGKHNPAYEELLVKYGIKYEYRWGLPDEEMVRRYEAADILSLASVYEGFGMPILEAQAVGRAVITSKTFSMPEVAGDAAYLADPESVSDIRNGILEIINNDEYRESIIAKGFENIRRFDPDKIAMQYFDLYQQVINENNQP